MIIAPTVDLIDIIFVWISDLHAHIHHNSEPFFGKDNISPQNMTHRINMQNFTVHPSLWGISTDKREAENERGETGE